jgi:hypothetical protein
VTLRERGGRVRPAGVVGAQTTSAVVRELVRVRRPLRAEVWCDLPI